MLNARKYAVAPAKCIGYFITANKTAASTFVLLHFMLLLLVVPIVVAAVVCVCVSVTFICPAVVQHAPCSPWLCSSRRPGRDGRGPDAAGLVRFGVACAK